MIVFIAPFPDETKGDGWMARILAVDEIFKDRPRVYVFHNQAYTGTHPEGYMPYHKKHDDLREEYILNFSFSYHVRVLTDLIAKADFVYAHTAHSAQFMYNYYQTGKIITDLHGLASLEEVMLGCPERGRFFGALEEPMVRESACLISVTRAMQEYYSEKYPNLTTPFILNPIRQALPECSNEELTRTQKDKPRVVFVGGCQEWQQPKKMLQMAKKLCNHYDFAFYSGMSANFDKIANDNNIDSNAYSMGFCPHDELGQLYKNADFGLVLRNSSPVNRVACPTKLMEYMAFGVIPIVELYEIGDFASYNYHAISYEDFCAGNIPDLETLNTMRIENARICHTVNALCDDGIEAIRSITKLEPAFDIQQNAARFLSHSDRMYFAHKPGVLYYRVENDDTEYALGLRDVQIFNDTITIDVPAQKAITSFRLHILEKPFVVSPLKVWIEDSNNNTTEVPIQETYTVDSSGNWLFSNDSFLYVECPHPIENICTLHIEIKILLARGEANYCNI